MIDSIITLSCSGRHLSYCVKVDAGALDIIAGGISIQYSSIRVKSGRPVMVTGKD